MAKLFALESAESDATSDLETGTELAEVAEASIEVAEDAAEIEDKSEAINEGAEAAAQLEQVEEIVETAADGDGLDPVAADAVKVAVEAICARVGANPKSIYSLYATENFQSASSRRANTRIALESVSEFLKNLWEKIKAALTSLWEKVVKFWDKHVSSLGRALKALESMKESVGKLKGRPGNDDVSASSSLLSVFPVKGNSLGTDEIEEYKATLDAAFTSIKSFKTFDQLTTNGPKTLNDFNTEFNKFAKVGATDNFVAFGSEQKPMPTGNYYKWTFNFESETEDGITTYTINVDEDHGKYNEGRSDVTLDIPQKDKLKSLISDTITTIKDFVKYKEKVKARAKVANDTIKSIDKKILEIEKNALSTAGNKADEIAKAKTEKKQTSKNLRIYNVLMSKGPMMEAKLLSLASSHARGVVSYVTACMKNYVS